MNRFATEQSRMMNVLIRYAREMGNAPLLDALLALKQQTAAVNNEYEVTLANLLAQAGQGELLDIITDWQD